MINLVIDGKPIRAVPGNPILWAALDNEIFIPSLCAIRKADPAISSCRLCLVEIAGRPGLAAACSEPVSEGIQVFTNSSRVNRARRAAFALIMTNHRVDCAHCPRDKNCGLQDLAQRLGMTLKQKRLRPLIPSFPIDDSHTLLRFDRNKCIICGKCVWTCRRIGNGALDFAGRGLETRLSLFGGQCFQHLDCGNCKTACASVCPTGALNIKDGPNSRRKATLHA